VSMFKSFFVAGTIFIHSSFSSQFSIISNQSIELCSSPGLLVKMNCVPMRLKLLLATITIEKYPFLRTSPASILIEFSLLIRLIILLPQMFNSFLSFFSFFRVCLVS
jgi:hypothetical protein